MRNIWRVFTRDLMRLVRVPLALVILGGALITPSLYAWVNIAAFWNPFDETGNMSVAVANLDDGASSTLTGEVNVGDQLVTQLEKNDQFDWHFLSEDAALESVRSGESYAAFVVPADFSTDLLSITTGEFVQPKLRYYVNEKINGVSPEITDAGASLLQTQMTDAFTGQVADAVASAIRTGAGGVEQDLIDTEATIIADLEQTAAIIAQTRTQLDELQTQITATQEGLRGNLDTLAEVDVTLGDVAGTLGDARALADEAQAALLTLAGEASTGYVIGSAEVAAAAATAIAGVEEVSAAADSLSAAVAAQRVVLSGAEDLVRGLDEQLTLISAALASLDGDLAAVEDDTEVAVSDLRALGGAALWQQLEALTELDPQQIAAFMSTPVEVDQHTLFPTGSYGSLMASLFINLSLWIGAFVLVVILKLDVDDEGIPDLTERQGYLGRWLLFAVIAVAQAVTLMIGNLIIGVQHVNTLAFVVTPVLIGLSYLSIIYALAVTFGYVGKGLAVLLVILQIPGASGIYPIELMPEFFQRLYPLFPFTYGIDAMREVVSGFAGLAYWRYLGMLLVFVALAFLLGLVLRRPVANLTRLFTQEVAATELFTTDAGAPAGSGYRVRHLLRAIVDRASYRTGIAARTVRFEHAYRPLRTGVVAAGVAGVLVLGGLAVAFPDAKTVLVGLWVLWLLAGIVALIALEFVRYSLRLSGEVGDMTDADLRRELAAWDAKR